MKKSPPAQSDLPKLAAPAQRALAAAGVQNLEQLTKFSEDDVRQWHGIGPNALKQLRQALAENGLSFAKGDERTPMKKVDPQQSDIPNIGQPARRALAAAGVKKLKHLTRLRADEVGQWHGVGPKALRILRSALDEKGWSFAGEKGEGRPRKTVTPTSRVDEFMQSLDHPFKKEVQVLSEIIMGVNKGIVEEIKWKAPSFSYKGEYLVTFNLWEKGRVHLVFHNPEISRVKSKLLEGDHDHRRMTYFAGMDEIQAKKSALEKALRDLIKLQKTE